jgi:sigma-B regulation protein RsbU (phosphoserine phosphatase)
MGTTLAPFIKKQLVDRRHKLEHAAETSGRSRQLYELLDEVDLALARIDEGTFGICESCHDSIESDRLICDPLVRFCLDHLNSRERDALQHDLELAARVQRGLLPRPSLEWNGWHVCYHYEPAGVVSGDYCDVIDAGDAGLFFLVGDVSGKGVAASMLMAHLHAMFRSLIPMGLSLKGILEHANRVFSESTLPNQYATLICGRALPDGKVEICNAGHPLPLIVQGGQVTALEQTNLPVGMFCCEDFRVTELEFAPEDGIVIYSDGVTDAIDDSGREYGMDRIRELIARERSWNSSALVAACRDDLSAFRRDATRVDDITLFVLGRGKATGLQLDHQTKVLASVI